jgi:serine/threonine protein kinase
MCEIVSGQTPFHGESTMKIYENINKCQPKYNPRITGQMRDLLNLIFVADPQSRATIPTIKQNPLFQGIQWDTPLANWVSKHQAPYTPEETKFTEEVIRKS